MREYTVYLANVTATANPVLIKARDVDAIVYSDNDNYIDHGLYNFMDGETTIAYIPIKNVAGMTSREI